MHGLPIISCFRSFGAWTDEAPFGGSFRRISPARQCPLFQIVFVGSSRSRAARTAARTSGGVSTVKTTANVELACGLASNQRDCVQEQRKRKHHYEVTRDPVAQTLITTQMGGVVLPLSLRKVPCQGSSMFAAVADRAVRHAWALRLRPPAQGPPGRSGPERVREYKTGTEPRQNGRNRPKHTQRSRGRFLC